MSSNSGEPHPRPVVVLTAGGAGRSANKSTAQSKRKGSGNNNNNNINSNKSMTVSSSSSSSSPPPPLESRESNDSFLDRDGGIVGEGNADSHAAPFADEPVATTMTSSREGESRREGGFHVTADKSSTNKNSSLSSKDPHGRSSNTGSMFVSSSQSKTTDLFWLLVCFLGIMASFVCYGLLLEYATSGGRKLHELSFLFVTSGLYTVTAAAGRYVRDETPTSIPPARFAVLGLTSMGSTFFSVRSLRYVAGVYIIFTIRFPFSKYDKMCEQVSLCVLLPFLSLSLSLSLSRSMFVSFCLCVWFLGPSISYHRYVIYPVQVLAKSCKPVPVMLMGAAMGKKYSLRKYINVCLIVLGVALFMGGGKGSSKHVKSSTEDGNGTDDSTTGASQLIGIVMLFISLCFDGGTGAYEDKLMSVHSVQPFDLMFNIQMGKTILAGIGLLVLTQIHMFVQMCNDMGFLLIALGLSGALGQVFIFVTIAKFGALTCSIIGLARKVTTLVASIWFYGHYLGPMQFMGLLISVGSMVMNFWGKKDKGNHHHGPPTKQDPMTVEELQKMLDNDGNAYEDEKEEVEMTRTKDEEAAVTNS